jgi:hypothetical protein
MPLESPIARDGDAGFIGFASRMNPVALPDLKTSIIRIFSS